MKLNELITAKTIEGLSENCEVSAACSDGESETIVVVLKKSKDENELKYVPHVGDCVRIYENSDKFCYVGVVSETNVHGYMTEISGFIIDEGKVRKSEYTRVNNSVYKVKKITPEELLS